MHLVMFDVDGTLVDSAGFDADLYAAAVQAVLGLTIDRNWDRYEHVSDRGILAELLGDRPAHEARALAKRVEACFVDLVRAHLARSGSSVREIKGARALIERLLATPSVCVAVATGGFEPTARLKLRHIGIDDERVALASSSDAAARTAIMRLAADRALRGAVAARSTYFGDGPWDRRASEELGYHFIAIGGGVEHEIRFADLADTEAILGALRLVESGAAS